MGRHLGGARAIQHRSQIEERQSESWTTDTEEGELDAIVRMHACVRLRESMHCRSECGRDRRTIGSLAKPILVMLFTFTRSSLEHGAQIVRVAQISFE